MIKIYLNNQEIALESACSLHEFLQTNGYHQQHLAIAINNGIVPKQAYGSTLLQAHDKIDIIVPMQGG